MKLNSDRIVDSTLNGAIIVAVLLCFLVLLSWMKTKDIEDAVEFHRTEARRVTIMLASCMNGKALVDKKTNTAYFCNRVVEMKL